MAPYFSFIVPVFNRPEEIWELLQSMVAQTYVQPFEVVIIEDGSTRSSEETILGFSGQLTIHYIKKPNTGPGDSRNYGMRRAKGSYFIILDSDCTLPNNYLKTVADSLSDAYVDCFGGPDAADSSFSALQKAINYAMTSFLTTGGIRGKKNAVDTFQPRSFNMGLSKKAFEKVGGFANIHPGEDPDLSIRLRKLGFTTKLMPEAFVYHKRRINWAKFYKQVMKFGSARPILNKWHPHSAKLTYWFPTIFVIFGMFAFIFWPLATAWPLIMYGMYFLAIFIDSLIKNKSLVVAFLSLFAVMIQFLGYGYGFLKSVLKLNFSHKKPEELFPQLFFKKQASTTYQKHCDTYIHYLHHQNHDDCRTYRRDRKWQNHSGELFQRIRHPCL